MGLVTAFCPLTVVQITGGARLVVDSKVKPVAFVGHVKITFAPEELIVSCGGLIDPNERLNTVPLPVKPP
jgi:hypothetical protein